MQYVLPAALAILINVATAFFVGVPQRIAPCLTTVGTRSTSSLHLAAIYPKEDFERAIECASETGFCKVEELNRLAGVLEAFQGCLVDEDCEQEQIDRQDVADILRQDVALQLRQVYLENVNLFKERVEEAREKEGLGEVMQTMVRAIECASKPGLCNDDELNRLADQLEAYKGCLVEEDGEQEMIDRQDVVDILRMASALQLRQVYLKNVNLFKERVEEARALQ